MERINILIDPKLTDQSALNFACYLAQLSASKITGVFIQEELSQGDYPRKQGRASSSDTTSAAVELERPPAAIQESITAFNNFCRNNSLSWTPDIVYVSSLEELIIESRFADLFIISAGASFQSFPESVPGELTSNILRNAECAIIIAPLSFETIEEVVFTYDGSPSSVYAIKQFTHLFPQFEDKKILFLEVNDNGEKDIQYRDKITDYLKMHYSSIGYQLLHGDAENELFGYFIARKNALIVMGAFGRSAVSSFFRRSTAHLLLKATSLPVFITHK